MSNESSSRGRVLIVDDEAMLLRVYTRALTQAGFTVQGAEDGQVATNYLSPGAFDAIVSDIAMPGIDGLELLRRVRAQDSNVPVVLITGAPQLKTAIDAVEFGALHYLMKPFGPQQLVDVVADAVRLRRLESKKREALEQVGGAGQAADREELESAFWKTLSSIEVAYEPVRVASSGELFGYVAAPHANDPKQSYRDTLIGTAQQVDRLRTLGRTVRNRIAFFLRTLPATVATMVPIHAHDLQDGSLAVADNLFAKHASRLVLEVAGGVPHDALASLHGRVASIRKLGFRFAADGLMATPSSLVAFAIIRPEILRIDFARLRGVARDLGVQAVVRGLVQLATAIGAQVLAEGLEEEVERESVIQLGCQLLHGPLVR